MSKQVKQYSINQIKALAKDYKFLCLEDSNGVIKVTWNAYGTKIDKHLLTVLKRFNSEAL